MGNNQYSDTTVEKLSYRKWENSRRNILLGYGLTVCGLWEDSNSKQLHNIRFVFRFKNMFCTSFENSKRNLSVQCISL